MEMKKFAKPKTLWKMSSTNKPLLNRDMEVSPLKKFTIPKIRRTAEKVFLSSCCTNTREYSFIHDTLKQCRLDVSCDLRATWQFGDTKLIHNEHLEKKFTAKRSEMRESGRHGRELEEHFCFLALAQRDMIEIYQHGIRTNASALKILGNPLLGIYIFRHVDVALNYAHSRSTAVESIVIFKVLFGKVKKVQPSMDKNKVSLDPSPNFDCHMSRTIPSVKETIELQAYNSAVYFYEYDTYSKPVDKPRQCLPYAVVTVKFIGQKVDNGHLIPSLKVLAPRVTQRPERTCSLNNCTVAKRIGKGKDATVIFEHFGKNVDSYVDESCLCSALKSELKHSNSNTSNSNGNVQNGNISNSDTCSGQSENNSEIRDTSQVYDSTPFMPRDSGNEDLLLNLAYLKSILSSISVPVPLQNNTASSTVITSKLIKDPRLMRREESIGKQSNITGLSVGMPVDRNLDHISSEINLSFLPTVSASSEVVPRSDTILANCLDASSFTCSFEDSQSQTHSMMSENYHCTASNKNTKPEQYKDQGDFHLPISLSTVVSEVENQNHNEEKAQSTQERSSMPLLIEQNSESYNYYESMNTRESKSHITQESQAYNFITVHQIGHQISTVAPFQKKGSIDEYIENTGKMRTGNFIDSEDNSKHGGMQTWWNESNNHLTKETKISPIDDCTSMSQEDKRLDSLVDNYENTLVTKEVELSKSPISTKEKGKIDDLALQLESNLTPHLECLSQKHLQHFFDYDSRIHERFSIAQQLIELKLEERDKKCFNIITDALQEAQDIPQMKELLLDTVISSTVKTALDSSECSITEECVSVQRKNENEPGSLENIQKDCKETLGSENECQDILFCNANLNDDIYLNIKFIEQGDNKENQNEAGEKTTSENNMEVIYESEKQGFHTHNILTNINEKVDNKNSYQVEMSSPKELSTFNLIWRKSISTETALLKSKGDVKKQKDRQNTGKNVENWTSMTISENLNSSLDVSNAAVHVTSTISPVSTNPKDHQRFLLNETCNSESPDFGLLVTHKASDCEIDRDKNNSQGSFHPPVDENLLLQNFELESEIEIETEECGDASLFQQGINTHGKVLYDEVEDACEMLTPRIDWGGLFGSSYEEIEASFTRENSNWHYLKGNGCVYSSTPNNTRKLLKTILPDLQIRITNDLFRPGFDHTDDSLPMKDNSHECINEVTKPEIYEERTPGFELYSQPWDENSIYSCEDKLDDSMQDSRLGSKFQICSSNSSHNIPVNHASDKLNSETLSTEHSNITPLIENKCSSANSKKITDTRNKGMESRISKRKLANKDLRHHEICGKKKRETSQDSSEHFSLLSQGRIKTFSRSERNIRNVLDILSSEASLCKSKRLSRKLDKAVLHLKKAHRRVHTSLQLISKVGEIKKGPLPKAYAIICNNFWESCDLEGYSSERRWYSKHFFSKRKYDRQGEKRAIGFDTDKSLVQMSKHRSYKSNGDTMLACLSKKRVANSVSRSHTSVHRELCDQEQHPESELVLSSTSQTPSQCDDSRNPASSELHPFSEVTDEKITEKEHVDETLSSSKHESLENHSTISNTVDTTKENSEANAETNELYSVSLSCMKENNGSYGTDKNYDTPCTAHTKVKADIKVTSVLKSDMKHVVNVGVYKEDDIIISGCKRNEVIFPVVEWTAPIESSTPSIITGIMDPLNLSLVTGKTYGDPPFFSTTPMTYSEGESSKSLLNKQIMFATDPVMTSTTVSHCQKIGDRKSLLKIKEFSSNCSHIDMCETNVSNHSELDLMSAIEENKYEKNRQKLFSKDYLPLKCDVKDSLKRCIAKNDVQNTKFRNEEKSEKADLVYKSNMHKASPVGIENKNQKNKILKEKSSHLSMKTSKLTDSHLPLMNKISGVIYLNNRDSHQLKRKKQGKRKVSNDSWSDCISKPSILRTNHVPIPHSHCETSKVTPLQKTPISYSSQSKEKHSDNQTSFIAELSQILQRANEASSLETLEKETKVCRDILPLFVEAFERKQECALEQILISRELLVGQNLWSNCRHKLKPCAVDTLVELQMVMETIQFIKNKKRLLEGEPTFRSLLWYDETLYSELLSRPRGYQLQSSFYPAFQGRLKYNAFSELQNYHNQLLDLLAETKRENSSYYAFLKYKRQINECEAIMKHCSDCFDFSLSIPFTCGVNLGDSLGDLEILRKSTLKLIGIQESSPKVHSYTGKEDHFWIIIEMIASKVNFIKINEEASIKTSLYGLEHIYFDAAKNLVWKEKRYSFSRNSQKNKEMLLEMNECAFAKLQSIYDTLSNDLNSEPTSNIGLDEDAVTFSRNPDDVIITENSRLNSALLSRPDICCIGEILDQAEVADLKKLQELTLRCTDHLEILKKYFQILQEDNIDNIFITEENILDVLRNDNKGAIILKPAAIETYIEIVMLSETVHFLKNSMAKKLNNQRFRSMLWFDLSLLPELIHCQEKMASFSFLNDATDCLWKVIETAISGVMEDINIIYKYNEAVNCSYALHLFSRELNELSEIKKLVVKSKYSISTYIDFVPCIASINYGNTVTELEHNYSQFSMLLKSTMSVPQKDLGKVAHITKVMKTIEHMKIICAKDDKLTTSFIFHQILHNRRDTSQLKRKEKSGPLMKHEENINKPSTSIQTPSISECLVKSMPHSTSKRPITMVKHEDSQEKENTEVSGCKKQKVSMNDTSKINRKKAAFSSPRTTKFQSKSENETGSSLKRNYVFSTKDELKKSLPGSLLPLKNLQESGTSKSESKIDLTHSSSDVSEYLTGHQESSNSIRKRNVNFNATETIDKDCPFIICDQKSIADTFSKDLETLPHELPKTTPNPAQSVYLSNRKLGPDGSLNSSVISEAPFHSVRDIHTHLEVNDTTFEHQDDEIINVSIKDCTGTPSPEPIYIQNQIPVLPVQKTQLVTTQSQQKDRLNSTTVPFGARGRSIVDVNYTAENSFSEGQDEEHPQTLDQKVDTYWNELPQSVYTPVYNSSEYSFGTSYPHYSCYVYQYSSSNGNAITHTYQGVTSYEVQPPPPGIFTTITNTVQNTHSSLQYSQYFTYFAGQPQANAFVLENGYFRPQIPISYHFQPPVFSQCAYQPPPQAAHRYPSPGALPEVPWTYDSWQEKPFQPGQ
ncbi:testis-expressed protein 15 [Perognathus longimembris pacificus]|uniref:testis-expressed protein 15 n=1 Tax=Perognathus longimembris pacificus TaxID=214514 RepID=UPI002019C5A3|nr:testis-expressed protein 15 [Perognathus longimembris pacificus]